MKKFYVLFVVPAVYIFLFASPIFSKDSSKVKSGKELFEEHCATCHPGGGNILNELKTLHKKDREANNIRTAGDIVNKVRNPGPIPEHPQDWAGMKMFNETRLPDSEAFKIADYILKSF